MLLRILGALILIIVALIALFAFLMQPAGLDEARSAWMTDEDRLVEAAGQTWRVRESGPESAPAIVLIHGFSHSLETWEPLADSLEADYRIIRFDLPGHALSDVRSDSAYSVPETVNQVAALLDEVAPERFVIGGSSLGGLVSWRYAAAHPDRVTGLVLISPGGYPNLGVGDEPAPVPAQVRLFLTTAPAAGVQAATGALYADPTRISEDQIERIGALMRVEGVGQALVERIEQFTLPDPNPVLREIEAPAVVIWGQRDAMIPATHGPRFAAALQNAELVLIEDAGHMPQEERPVQVSAVIRDFLEGLDG
ncbi:MAG: alpha/beta fold hydrolase [Alphaproteobacteria bacterium]|nr:alpha/beta fold hydrolase [Alphaproteobacteria bacterium]